MDSRYARVNEVIIGEALNRRVDLQKRLAQLQDRLRASVLVHEGEEPPEDPADLLQEVDAVCDALQELIAQINHTNAESRLSNGETVTEALARRDVIGLRRGALKSAVDATTDRGFSAFRRSDVRMVRQIKVSDVRAQIDALARERRELDTLLQRNNWTAPLIG